MRVAVFGAGGIGAYTGGRLVASGHEVVFIARSAQLAALRDRGLTIRSPRGNARLGPLAATSDPAEVGQVDLILFCVKLWDTEEAARALAPMLGPKTLVITFQNGVDSADIIGRHLDSSHITQGAYYISAHLIEPGVIEDVGAEARMTIDSRNGDERLKAFKEACEQSTGLACQLSDGSVDFIWQKFIILTAFSGATALVRKPLGAILHHPATREFLRELVDEVATIAIARGRRLPSNVAELVFARLTTWSVEAYASMAVDLLHGRRLELPWLSGRVHQLGAEMNIPTPAHTSVYRGLVLHEMGQSLDDQVAPETGSRERRLLSGQAAS